MVDAPQEIWRVVLDICAGSVPSKFRVLDVGGGDATQYCTQHFHHVNVARLLEVCDDECWHAVVGVDRMLYLYGSEVEIDDEPITNTENDLADIREKFPLAHEFCQQITRTGRVRNMRVREFSKGKFYHIYITPDTDTSTDRMRRWMNNPGVESIKYYHDKNEFCIRWKFCKPAPVPVKRLNDNRLKIRHVRIRRPARVKTATVNGVC